MVKYLKLSSEKLMSDRCVNELNAAVEFIANSLISCSYFSLVKIYIIFLVYFILFYLTFSWSMK